MSRELLQEDLDRLGVKDASEMTLEQVQWIRQRLGSSEERVRQFEEAFSVFDRDSDGHITTTELGEVMQALGGHRPTLRELKRLIRANDTDHSGTLDFREFLAMMTNSVNPDPDSELHDVFSVFDLNSDGFITSDELQQILARLGETTSEKEVLEMIKEADVDGDGKVNFSEFKGILKAK